MSEREREREDEKCVREIIGRRNSTGHDTLQAE